MRSLLICCSVLLVGAAECRAGWCLDDLFGITVYRHGPRYEVYDEYPLVPRYYSVDPEYRLLPYWRIVPRPRYVPQPLPSQHYHFGIEYNYGR